jgi:hypothetical protein
VFTALLSPLYSQGVDKDYLWAALTFSDNDKMIETTKKIAGENPKILEEVLFIVDQERDNVIGRENAFLILQQCSVQNELDKDYFFDVAYKLLSKIEKIVFPKRLQQEKLKFASLLGSHGFDYSNGKFRFPLSEAFKVLIIQLNKMHSYGLISNKDILNNLKEKISLAMQMNKSSAAKKSVISVLRSAVAESKKSGNAYISEEAMIVFSKFCEAIICHLRSL